MDGRGGHDNLESKKARTKKVWGRGEFLINHCKCAMWPYNKCVYALCVPCRHKRTEKIRGETAEAKKRRIKKAMKKARETETGDMCDHWNLIEESDKTYLACYGNDAGGDLVTGCANCQTDF